MKTRKIIKVIVLVIGSLLIVFGVYCLISSWCFFRQLKQWSKANALDIKVDLSLPGEYSNKFDLKCPYASSHELLLVLPNFQQEEFEKKGSWDGLEGQFSFFDRNGAEIDWLSELEVSPKTKISEGEVLLLDIGGLPRGTYMLRLTVSKGAKALSGVEQRLVMHYLIGFAAIGPILYLVMGVPSFTVGVLLVFLMIRLLKKKAVSLEENQHVTTQGETG
jgi:hypothetical protein